MQSRIGAVAVEAHIEIVGHSAIEMIMNAYGHVSLDSQREALGLLDDQLGTPTDDQPEE